MNLPLKAVLESVLIGAISAVLLLIIAFIPLLNIVMFLWPVPLIVVGIRRGVWAGILSLTVAGFLISILLQPLLGLLLFVLNFFLVAGLSIGLGKKWDFYENILISTGGTLLSILLSLKVYSWTAGQTIFDVAWLSVRNLITDGAVDFSRMMTLYHQMGLLKNFTTDEQLAEFLIEQMQFMVPSALIIFSLMFGVLNLLVARLAIKRFNYEVPFVPAFQEWTLPRGMGFGFLVLLLIAFFGTSLGITNFEIVRFTIMSLVAFIFMIQGLAVVWFFLKAGRVPVVLRWVLIILIYVIIHVLLTYNMGLTLVGMLDQIFGLRRNYKRKFVVKPQ